MRCADPATFVDSRPERMSGSKINDAIFTQLTFASTPDPSVYMLEPLTRAIYRFSPRSDSLEMRGQFRATMEQNNAQFDGLATAIAIGRNRNSPRPGMRADMAIFDEGASTCCYASSEKHWITDPQGIAWEKTTAVTPV